MTVCFKSVICDKLLVPPYIASLGLKNIEPYLKSNQKAGVITNENDFILSNEDRDYLRQLFGERAKIYPRGGHDGNSDYNRDKYIFLPVVSGLF